MRGSSSDGAIESAPSDLPLMQVTRQGPGGPRADPDAPPESLEAKATSESAWALLDSEKLRAIGRVSSRLLGKFVSETWSDYFDAVVVIRQEVAPTFDPWK